jgi:hypothetical protein
MLAMHYRIALPNHDAIPAIRRRATEKGPLCDGLPGLALKFFLLDTQDPTYATFYLWNDPDGARAFLEGPFFAALSETFGRPQVRLFVTTAVELPAMLPGRIGLVEDAPRFDGPRIETLDPLAGARFALSLSAPPLGRQLEIMYTAKGTGVIDLPALNHRSTT